MAKREQFDPSYMNKFFTESLTDKIAAENSGWIEIATEDLLPWHTGGGHPFPVEDDADMAALEEDIRENGLLEPLIVREDANLEGRYEVIAGHRRSYVCRKLGIEKVKALVVDYTDEQATKLMVVSNLQKRSEIKPSVKAAAYLTYIQANKQQAGRPEKNSSQLETNFRTDEKAAEEFGESRATIQRYVRLNALIEPLLAMVDAGQLKFTNAVELSFLDEAAQEVLHTFMSAYSYVPTLDDAEQMKRDQKAGVSIDASYLRTLTGLGQPEEVHIPLPREKKPKINERFINDYLPAPMKKRDTKTKQDYITAALIQYNCFVRDNPEEAEKWNMELEQTE